MKYSCEVDIDLPVARTVELWSDESQFSKWQDGFKSIELLSGTHNTVGAKSKIILEAERKIELIETLIINDLPNQRTALYEHVHMTNTQTSRFVPIEEHRTKYISEVEYTQFNGILIKLMAKLFPGKFKAQSQKWMVQFKQFAEKNK